MSAQTLAVRPHYKSTIIKKQTIGGTSGQITQVSLSDILAAVPPINTNNGIIPRPDNIYVQANPGNSGTITIAPNNPAVDGGPGHILAAGVGIDLPLRDASKYYIVGSAAGQNIEIHYQYGVD